MCGSQYTKLDAYFPWLLLWVGGAMAKPLKEKENRKVLVEIMLSFEEKMGACFRWVDEGLLIWVG
jgi:hypothetical protein